MEHTVKELIELTDKAVNEINSLLPQLSKNALLLTVSDLELIIKNESSRLLVSVIDKNIVGMLTLTVNRIPTGIKSMIEDVVVSSRYRQFGIAQELVDFALKMAKDMGAKSVELTSRPSREAANKLYVKMGFETRETNVYRYSFGT